MVVKMFLRIYQYILSKPKIAKTIVLYHADNFEIGVYNNVLQWKHFQTNGTFRLQPNEHWLYTIHKQKRKNLVVNHRSLATLAVWLSPINDSRSKQAMWKHSLNLLAVFILTPLIGQRRSTVNSERTSKSLSALSCDAVPPPMHRMARALASFNISPSCSLRITSQISLMVRSFTSQSNA